MVDKNKNPAIGVDITFSLNRGCPWDILLGVVLRPKAKVMKTSLTFILLVGLVWLTCQAQFITHGPLIGGVTDTSARMYVKTATPQGFEVEIDMNASFAAPRIFADSTRHNLYGAVIPNLTGLQPDVRYFYRLRFGATVDSLTGTFKTFPAPGSRTPLKIVVGSCNYDDIFSLFQHLQNFQADLFLHLGDWNWPPAQFGNDYNLHPDKIAGSFASRYADDNMRHFVFPSTPVDYIYDDDYSWNDSEGWTYPRAHFTIDSNGKVRTFLETDTMPAGIREGAIKGYFDHFPGYDPVDTAQGIYHSFRIGNVEIFMLDVRNSQLPLQKRHNSLCNAWFC